MGPGHWLCESKLRQSAGKWFAEDTVTAGRDQVSLVAEVGSSQDGSQGGTGVHRCQKQSVAPTGVSVYPQGLRTTPKIEVVKDNNTSVTAGKGL